MREAQRGGTERGKRVGNTERGAQKGAGAEGETKVRGEGPKTDKYIAELFPGGKRLQSNDCGGLCSFSGRVHF